MKLSFRPHHFLRTIAFQGLGYFPAFVQNDARVVATLQQNE